MIRKKALTGADLFYSVKGRKQPLIRKENEMSIAKEVLVHPKKGVVTLENIGNGKVRYTENRKLIAMIPMSSALSLCHDLFANGWRVS